MPELQFKIGQQVTCLFREIAYEARIQEIKDKDGPKPVYVVHFIGWNSRYDEDVPYDQANGKLFPESAADYVMKHGGKLDDRYSKQTNVAEKEQPLAESGGESTSAKKTRKRAPQGAKKAEEAKAKEVKSEEAKSEEVKSEQPKLRRKAAVEKTESAGASKTAKKARK